ncbi:MAG TPA: flagellar export chaperone FliS [Burkholderiaceae bacterium]|jgi:flagellar protein FliS|nr:flagellar export chaperone FliS [Burkholderiaceae bacterium]
MNGFGAQVYKRVGVDSGVAAADPHRLVLMLFDGALEAIKQAEAHIAGGRIAEKGQALGKAVRIVEEGLKASLDVNAGGALAQQLAALYDYAALRLLQANLRNDRKALAEVSALLADLRGAWASIGAARTPAAAPDENARRLAVTA